MMVSSQILYLSNDTDTCVKLTTLDLKRVGSFSIKFNYEPSVIAINAISDKLEGFLKTKPTSQICLTKFHISGYNKFKDEYPIEAFKRLVYTVGKFKTKIAFICDDRVLFNQGTLIFRIDDLQFGYISSLQMFVHDYDATINKCFRKEDIKHTYITKLTITYKNADTSPMDNIRMSELIRSGRTLTHMRQVAPDFCHALRINRDLVNNFNNICLIVYQLYKIGSVNKDIMNYIISFMHPRDWHIDNMQSNRRLTTKTSTNAKNICKQYKCIRELQVDVEADVGIDAQYIAEYFQAKKIVDNYERGKCIRSERIARKTKRLHGMTDRLEELFKIKKNKTK